MNRNLKQNQAYQGNEISINFFSGWCFDISYLCQHQLFLLFLLHCILFRDLIFFLAKDNVAEYTPMYPCALWKYFFLDFFLKSILILTYLWKQVLHF